DLETGRFGTGDARTLTARYEERIAALEKEKLEAISASMPAVAGLDYGKVFAWADGMLAGLELIRNGDGRDGSAEFQRNQKELYDALQSSQADKDVVKRWGFGVDHWKRQDDLFRRHVYSSS